MAAEAEHTKIPEDLRYRRQFFRQPAALPADTDTIPEQNHV